MASSGTHASPQPTLATSDPTAAPEILLGPSPAMAVLRSRIQRVAPYFRTALLTGEPGSGHEAVARALHHLSPLASRPFVVLRSAEAEARLATNPSLASFTEGMLYLPEPGRLSQPAQTNLLRLLRDRGAQAPRLVTFAERGLRSLTGSCGLSPSLADTLGALQIEVPPLRQRPEDIPHLTHFVFHHLAASLNLPTPTLDPNFLTAASNAPWPNNLDHLQAALYHLLESTHARSQDTPLTSADLDSALATLAQTPTPQHPPARLIPLDQVIREQVQAVLHACNGNKLRAAEILGISRSTLYRMLDTLPTSHSDPAHS